MSSQPFEKPVGDSVSKIDGEIAVGEDLEFQRKWWRFERVAWVVVALLIGADLAGAFGRGPLAYAQISSSAMHVKYERIERADSPSILRVQLNPNTFHDGKAQLFINESIVDGLGAQRVIPAPASSTIGNGGITYTFDASAGLSTVSFALEPTHMGFQHFSLQVPGTEPVQGRIVVVP